MNMFYATQKCLVENSAVYSAVPALTSAFAEFETNLRRERQLEVEDSRKEKRRIQQEEEGVGPSGPTAEFNMEFDVQPTTDDATSGSLSIYVRLSSWSMILVAVVTTSLSLVLA